MSTHSLTIFNFPNPMSIKVFRPIFQPLSFKIENINIFNEYKREFGSTSDEKQTTENGEYNVMQLTFDEALFIG